jgi:hypothetical protein
MDRAICWAGRLAVGFKLLIGMLIEFCWNGMTPFEGDSPNGTAHTLVSYSGQIRILYMDKVSVYLLRKTSLRSASLKATAHSTEKIQ